MAKTIELASVVVLVFAWLGSAQSQPSAGTSSLLVTVVNADGNFVRDLTKDDFRIRVNGRPVAPRDASFSVAPRRIVVLLDMSSSMASKTKWQVAREAVDDLIADTPPEVHIALFTFSNHVRDAFDFSQSRDSMAKWLKENADMSAVNIRGTTGLYNAVLAAAKLLQPGRSGDAIYIITDGGDNASDITETEIRKILLRSKIRLFVFLLDEPSTIARGGPGPDSVVRTAHVTGGFIFGVRSGATGAPSGINEYAFDFDDRTRTKIKLCTLALNIRINSFFTLEFDLPPLRKKVSKVSVEVVDTSGRARKDLSWSYPKELVEPGK